MSRPGSPPRNDDGTERRLRETLEALADQVHPAPGAYRAAHRSWRRRERRRRLALVTAVAAVFALAVLAGLWVLNSAPSASRDVFPHGTTPPTPPTPATPAAPPTPVPPGPPR
ncbi:hypothetical protein [Streptomyces yaizuensis]|uniref:Uncharacterized protein n=1 Tax=Streptomyces yaizuensis TaxID=2989713 RepID=A0ABQ5NTJ7_9ACTN|nr:hypothetical protein [Streptomyces sp. YSPA8]GLF93336.1 hypothetical protein SYYSPA8_03585 [Streptomyces sp. YSPA8]